MTPDIDLRISTMLRAMQDVISPAIDSSNSLAKEQAALVIGHLKLLAMQWHRCEDYAGLCLSELERSLEGLDVAGGARTRQAHADLLRLSEDQSGGSAEARYKALMRAAEILVRAANDDGDPDFRSTLRARLLAFSKQQAVRDRSWFALSGFDLRPEELSPVDAMIGRN